MTSSHPADQRTNFSTVVLTEIRRLRFCSKFSKTDSILIVFFWSPDWSLNSQWQLAFSTGLVLPRPLWWCSCNKFHWKSQTSEKKTRRTVLPDVVYWREDDALIRPGRNWSEEIVTLLTHLKLHWGIRVKQGNFPTHLTLRYVRPWVLTTSTCTLGRATEYITIPCNKINLE